MIIWGLQSLRFLKNGLKKSDNFETQFLNLKYTRAMIIV